MRTSTVCATVLALSLLNAVAAFAGEPEWASDINKAKFFEQNGSFADAETVLQDSLELASRLPDKRAIVFSDLELGNLYASWGRNNIAATVYQQAFDEAKGIDAYTEMFALRRAIKHCQKVGDKDLVSKWQERYHKLLAQKSSGPDMSAYVVGMERALRLKWTPTARNARRSCTVMFIIEPTGKVSLLHLQSSSQDEDADAHAITAVASAAPFQALPAGAPPAGIPMEYTFNYKPAPHSTEAPALEPEKTVRYKRHIRRDP